jgi:phosphate transport system substrate-binding protein
MKAVYFLLLVLLGVSFGCTKKSKQNDANYESATVGSFELLADEALRPAVDSLVQGFMAENPKAKITVKYVSSGEAIQALLGQKARLVIVSRFLNKVEHDALNQAKVTLPEYDIAQDGLACIVSSSSSLDAISMVDLRKIVRNEAKNWSELSTSEFVGGKKDGAIKRVIGPPGSTSEYLLDSLFLDPNQLQQGNVERFVTSDSIIARVRGDQHAIGFIGSAWRHWLDARKDSSVKVIPVIPGDSAGAAISKPIALHMAYVYQGLYPLTTRVNGYTFESPNTLPRGFIAYATTAHGQTVFKNFEVLPRTQIIKIIPSK